MPKTSSSARRGSDDQRSLFSEAPASRSASRASASEWMTHAATWPSSALALLADSGPAGWFSRTSPVSFRLTPEATRRSVRLSLEESASKSNGGATDSCPSLMVKKIVTSPPSSPPFGNAGILAATEFLTLSIPEFRSDAVASSLSDILETGDLPRRYFLSPKACAGIVRRAAKRGKELPAQLKRALNAAASETRSASTATASTEAVTGPESLPPNDPASGFSTN
jgi:hypothetical protein